MVIDILLWAGSDEEMDKLAEEEEEEALALQRHMAASLEEQDFDAADFEVCLYFFCLRSMQTSACNVCKFVSSAKNGISMKSGKWKALAILCVADQLTKGLSLPAVILILIIIGVNASQELFCFICLFFF